ncbi:DUF2219 family protein [bacterium]|nr:DUF2219 family protein [bacterium]
MFVRVATSVFAVSCMGCAAAEAQEHTVIQIDRAGATAEFTSSARSEDKFVDAASMLTPLEGRLPLSAGSALSPSNWASQESAAQFKALDLSTPMPVRGTPGTSFTAEVSLAASAERTGLGLDVAVAPRAQIQRDQAGSNVARAGAEVRLGQNLTARDQRGSAIEAPSWYFFVGADGEALVWNVADKQSVNGVALRDQVTVGDLQAGVAWTRAGGQMSFGLVEREMSFSDVAGQNSVSTREHFAAFSFTLRH